MTLLRWIPVLSLGVVLGIVIVSGLSSPPIDFPFTDAPEGSDLPAAEIQVGDRTLFGLVLGSEDEPLSGAGVSIQQGTRPYFTWTDPGGRFVLNELLAGDVRVLIVARGYQATAFETAGVQATSAQEPKTFRLDRPIGAPPTPPGIQMANLSGRVDFSPSAEPGLGPGLGPEQRYELLLQPTTAPTDGNGGFPRRVRVAPDGTFEVELLHLGRYRAILLSPKDRGGSGPDLLASADGTPRTFEHVEDREVPALVLSSTAGAVQGVVFAEQAAKPGEGATVRGALIRAERIMPGPAPDPAGTGPGTAAIGSDEKAGNGDGNERRLERSEFRAVQSGPTGKYIIRDLSPGRYLVSLVAGRRRQEFTIDVPPRGTMTFDMWPTPPKPVVPPQ